MDDDDVVPTLVPLATDSVQEESPTQLQQTNMENDAAPRRLFEHSVPVTLITGFLGEQLNLACAPADIPGTACSCSEICVISSVMLHVDPLGNRGNCL
jgi:hypothetical protein